MLLLALWVTVAAPSTSWAKSLALVIGNDSYRNIESLRKARADARSYSEFFAAQGFLVTRIEDADAGAMATALAGFYATIAEGDTVAFVYSGHGWSDGEVNYLVATDARAGGTEEELARLSVPLSDGADGILDRIAAQKPKLTLAIVDACRNNPFQVRGDRGMPLGRGLVPVEAASGTFVAFSAGTGQTALDGLSTHDREPNSVFTRYFLAELKKPQDLQAAFKAAQSQVYAAAQGVGHFQRPAYYDEVVGEVCLTGSCVAPPEQFASGSSPPTMQNPPPETKEEETSRNRIGINGDWGTFVEEDSTICWAATSPKTAREVDRAGVRLSGTQRQVVLSANYFRGQNTTAEIAFTGGYELAEGPTVTLDIGAAHFTFGARGVWAWSEGPRDDARIIATMESAAAAVLTARAASGRTISYTFSLVGFGEALEMARQRCQ